VSIKKVMDCFPTRVFHELVKSDDMNLVYKKGDITVIPTLYAEGTSLSCLEAMAAGNCVIATKYRGIKLI